MPILDIGEFLYRVEKNKNYNKTLLRIVLSFQIINASLNFGYFFQRKTYMIRQLLILF